MNPPESIPHLPVIIVGGGQAGLSLSACLQQRGIEHLVLEKHSAMHARGAPAHRSRNAAAPRSGPGFPAAHTPG